MILIAGLGNPGEKYQYTRHNAGFMLVEAIAAQLGAPAFLEESKFFGLTAKVGEVLLLKPLTFMNESGKSVRAAADYYSIEVENIVVGHDDLDIGWGDYKIQQGKGPKVHNGVASVEKYVKDVDFWRVRLGVDSRTKEERGYYSGQEYVLKRLSADERGELKESVRNAGEALLKLLRGR